MSKPKHKPPLTGTQRAKNALAHSPWNQGFTFSKKANKDGKKAPTKPINCSPHLDGAES